MNYSDWLCVGRWHTAVTSMITWPPLTEECIVGRVIPKVNCIFQGSGVTLMTLSIDWLLEGGYRIGTSSVQATKASIGTKPSNTSDPLVSNGETHTLIIFTQCGYFLWLIRGIISTENKTSNKSDNRVISSRIFFKASERQRMWLPPCPLVIVLLPLKFSSRNLYFPRMVPFIND